MTILTLVCRELRMNFPFPDGVPSLTHKIDLILRTLPAPSTDPIQPTAIAEESSVNVIERTPTLFILRDQFET
jgi:hypothetical protein